MDSTQMFLLFTVPPLQDDSESETSAQDTTESFFSILARLAELEKPYARERAGLLRAFNIKNIEEPTTGNSPSKILSKIFEYACPAPEFVKAFDAYGDASPPETLFPLTLCSVSSLWRQAVRSTPEVWTYLVLDVKERPRHIYDRILDEYITNSGPHPLRLELRYTTTWPGCTQLMKEVILPKIAPKASSLTFVNFINSSLAGLAESELEFPILRDLAIVDDTDHELGHFVIDRERMPKILRFALHAYPEWKNVNIEIPWDVITEVRLREIPAYVAVRALVKGRNSFRTFHAQCDDLSRPSETPAFEFNEPLELTQLTSFS
ncbi:hypothetical protein NP233_g411 [Leucocoprinus birnbaumii]|uniref:F-box domain-containing protein n=1 Tax=Leucocoprinus birnbaumii TaxID=56174 RepID=A0AAD5W268_9AGAR|nr:hypothetical protein NP233_g411 [Leucocoprinus birnbaumii]